ncbi:RICIN domain-containing protein [Streptomyces sp. RKAG290]|uniref:RICIN domain-containing protein n=1 Tax=Streptomyces sp. RKAG290 TaxID=2888348 RepID=UPI0035A9229F
MPHHLPCPSADRNEGRRRRCASQWNCHGGTSQKWTVKSDGTIVAQQSGLCLDVKGGKTANGTELQLWTCNGTANQKWTWQR